MQPDLLRASTPSPRSPDASINVDRLSTSFHGGADERSRLLPEPHKYAQSSAVELTDQVHTCHCIDWHYRIYMLTWTLSCFTFTIRDQNHRLLLTVIPLPSLVGRF